MSTSAITETFINSSAPLKPADAVAAIILDEHNRVLLQLRDDIPQIFFPNHWGLFGGAFEPGETKLDALHRELEEELSLKFDENNISEFMNIAFNPKPDSRPIDRFFFIVQSHSSELEKLTIGEGQMSKLFTAEEAMKLPNVTPYDRFGLWFYYNQQRIEAPDACLY